MQDITVEINHVTSLESAKIKDMERLRSYNTMLQEHKEKNALLQKKLDDSP